MDHLVDKHEKVEELMASDLDHWLCNMYFEIVKLPRYVYMYMLYLIYCKILFIREDFIFTLIRESIEMQK